MAEPKSDSERADRELSASDKARNIRIPAGHVRRQELPKAFDVPEKQVAGEGVSPQELQFVRRVTELLPILSQEQVEALRKRIEEGYYSNPEVTRIIARRLAEIFGTD